MIPVTELRAGRTFQIDDTPYVVLKYAHTKMGRGGATIRVQARNLKTSGIEEKTFNSGSVVEPATTQKRKLQYLYQDAENAVFMDPKTYEQAEISKEVLGDSVAFLKEGQEVDVLFWEPSTGSGQAEPLSVELPSKVTLQVTEAAPGVKGNSATNIYKPVTLENGLQVKVPLFIKTGDKVVVNTRSGEYVERAK